MAPMVSSSILVSIFPRQAPQDDQNAATGDWRAESDPEDLIIESWSQGFMVGALVVMACITVANMRRGVLLHKLILLELLSAMSHGTFCFMNFHGNGWYLSGTATMLYLSWILHNVVAWVKVKPFFTSPRPFFRAKVGTWTQRVYLSTLALTVPVILFQISDNYRYFNNRGGWYIRVRPYEPLMRDPWWVFVCLVLFHVIRKCYGTGVLDLIRRSPRLGIMLTAIAFSMIFTTVDIAASIHSFSGKTDGINPWWKLSLVFKCLTDTIMLDDFKTELKRLGVQRMTKESRRNSDTLITDPLDSHRSLSVDDNLHQRRDTIFRLHNPFQNKNFSNASTVVQQSFDPPEKDDDPLLQQKIHGTSDLSHNVEEREFVPVLSHNSTNEPTNGNTRRTKHYNERENVGSSPKKIARLPGLRDMAFEAIKPAKRSSKYDSSENFAQSDGDNGRPRTAPIARKAVGNTVTDLEAQKQVKNDDGGEERRMSEDEEAEARLRLRRFKDSIGAAD